MRILLLFFQLILYSCSAAAQDTVLNTTSWYWLQKARAASKSGDASATFNTLKEAAKVGLFDLQPLDNSVFKTLLKTSELDLVRSAILANRKRIASPDSIKIISSDIDHFWKIFPQHADIGFHELLMKEYLGKGSAGLKTFYQIRMNNSVLALEKKLNTSGGFYESIRDASSQFSKMKPDFIRAARKLEALYPESVFPPIYFLIGYLNNVGTADGYAGLLIGTEHLCKTVTTDTSTLSDFDKMVLFDSTLAVPLVVHEYVHFQQHNKPENTVLELTVMEGAADFITWLITGRYTNPGVFAFGKANEPKIREHFFREMKTENTDNWLFNAYNPQTGYPGNLGYYIGFRICEKYYQKAGDKSNAIQSMLNIQNFEEFLKISGY